MLRGNLKVAIFIVKFIYGEGKTRKMTDNH